MLGWLWGGFDQIKQVSKSGPTQDSITTATACTKVSGINSDDDDKNDGFSLIFGVVL